MNYNGIDPGFTDGEYARLRAIKDAPGWKPNIHTAKLSKVRSNLSLNPFLMERAKVYAETHDISFAVLVENMLSVIVD